MRHRSIWMCGASIAARCCSGEPLAFPVKEFPTRKCARCPKLIGVHRRGGPAGGASTLSVPRGWQPPQWLHARFMKLEQLTWGWDEELSSNASIIRRGIFRRGPERHVRAPIARPGWVKVGGSPVFFRDQTLPALSPVLTRWLGPAYISVMTTFLMIRCPTTGQQYECDVATDCVNLTKTWKMTKDIQCKGCGEMHPIKIRDAFVDMAVSRQNVITR